ncbi:serine/threonine protein kinase [Planctomycetota bacterium]
MAVKHSLLFARLLTLSGQITQAQYKDCIAVQKELAGYGNQPPPIDDIILKKKLIDPALLGKLQALQMGTARVKFGEIANQQNLCWSEQMEENLIKQKQYWREGKKKLIGEVLVELKFLEPKDVDQILTIQGEAHGLSDRQFMSARAKDESGKTPWKAGMKVGHYQLEEKLRGSLTCSVFTAFDTDTNKKVELQIFSEANPKNLEKVQENIKLVQRLGHERFVRSLPPETLNSSTFFVPVPAVGGSTVQMDIEFEENIPWEGALPILEQAIEGLQAAQRIKVIHGNLTPDDLIILDDRSLVINNLGSVSSARLSPFAYLEHGSCYTAPERIFGSQMDHHCDIFSLGAILYFMLTGKPLLPGKTIFDGLLKLSLNPVPPLKNIPKTRAAKIYPLICKMTHPLPNMRYPDYDSLLKDLREIGVEKSSIAIVEEPEQKRYFAVDADLQAQAEDAEAKDAKRFVGRDKYKYYHLKRMAFLAGVGAIILGICIWAGNYIRLVIANWNEPIIEAFEEPEGSFREKIKYYTEIIASDPDQRRREKAVIQLGKVKGKLNSEARKQYRDLNEEMVELFKSRKFQAALAVWEHFDLELFYTDEWAEKIENVQSKLQRNTKKKIASLHDKVSLYVDTDQLEEAVKYLQPFLESDYGKCRKEAESQLARVNKIIKEEQDRIAMASAEERAASRARVDQAVQDMVPALRNFDFTRALENLDAIMMNEDKVILDGDLEKVMALINDTESWHWMFVSLMDNSYPLCQQAKLQIELNQRSYQLLRGTKQGTWTLFNAESNKMKVIERNRLDEKENFTLLWKLMATAGHPDGVHMMTRYFIFIKEYTYAAELYEVYKKLGLTDDTIASELE